MDDFTTQAGTTADAAFQARVKQAVIAQAILVASEASDVYNHENRLAWSATVLRSISADYLDILTGAVAADGTTNASSNDGAIDTRVAAITNALSGVL